MKFEAVVGPGMYISGSPPLFRYGASPQ